MHKSHELYNSAVSYGIGVFSLIIASLPEIANVAQNLAIILGCGVVAIRLAHDALRFLHYIRDGK